MSRCYLVCWRLPADNVIKYPLTPVGTVVDRIAVRPLGEVLPAIEVVAKRQYHKMMAQMDELMLLNASFNTFTLVNATEKKVYGDALVGFFPVLRSSEHLPRSGNRIEQCEAYLVYETFDNVLID